MGIFLFLFKLGSRRALKLTFARASSLENLKPFLNGNKIPHGDTLAYLLERLSYIELEWVKTFMIRRLLRMKCFINFRLLGYYLVAVDGTRVPPGCSTFSQRHCDHCLTRTLKDGTTQYYHYVLEAKLLLANGMALSLATEFVENPQPNPTKQDCELKAFYRLCERLKSLFPQLKIMLLLDSIYLNQRVLGICRRYRWGYIITFKKGSLPTVFQEFESLKPLEPNNSRKIDTEEKTQQLRWVNEIPYYDYQLHVLECLEHDKKTKENKRFVWVSSFKLHYHNAHLVANEGGRLRWKIENEGFNTQKNQGYELEHQYSQDYQAMKCFYILMQIAHILNLLMEKGSLMVQKIKQLGGIKYFAKKLLEEFLYLKFPFDLLDKLLKKKIQIRFFYPP